MPKKKTSFQEGYEAFKTQGHNARNRYVGDKGAHWEQGKAKAMKELGQ